MYLCLKFNMFHIIYTSSGYFEMKHLCILPLLTAVVVAINIAASGVVTVNSNPYQAAVIVPKVDNSYYLAGLNAFKANIDLLLRTTVSRTSQSATEDKLTITSTMTPVGGGLIYQIEIGYLVVVEFETFEIAPINISSNTAYTSTKNLMFTGVGSVRPYTILTGFSDVYRAGCFAVSGTVNSTVYQVGMSGGCIAVNKWISGYLILMKNQLIPQCPGSQISEQTALASNWLNQKLPNYLYFFGIQSIYQPSFLGRGDLTTNTFIVEAGGDSDVLLIAIDLQCFETAKYPNQPLEAWKIALICIGSLIFLALVGLLVYFIIKKKRQQAVQQSDPYELSGAALGIASTPIDPMLIQVKNYKTQVIPEEKKEWTKEELDEKFGS